MMTALDKSLYHGGMMTALEPSRHPSTDKRIEHAFDILHYNQNLIQFADSKANTLIVINSIALASTAASSAGVPLMGALKIGFMLAAVVSIILCLMVVVARSDPPDERARRDLIFFGDVMSRSSSNAYYYDFTDTKSSIFLEDLLERNYRVAGIAERKYRFYRMAQVATVAACLLWLTHLLISTALQGLG
ncbi:MAG: hypothetical protein FJX76_09370 [Armatimonadetes bacterium]|nr:hypothetical protein [Armatimonadota bacterium]